MHPRSESRLSTVSKGVESAWHLAMTSERPQSQSIFIHLEFPTHPLAARVPYVPHLHASFLWETEFERIYDTIYLVEASASRRGK